MDHSDKGSFPHSTALVLGCWQSQHVAKELPVIFYIQCKPEETDRAVAAMKMYDIQSIQTFANTTSSEAKDIAEQHFDFDRFEISPFPIQLSELLGLPQPNK